MQITIFRFKSISRRILFSAIGMSLAGVLWAEGDKKVIADFSQSGAAEGWRIEDDVVMGGRSRGVFSVADEGFAIFSGDVSLENNGGFSSVQYAFEPINVDAYSAAYLRIRGDGKNYNFLVESGPETRHYYVYEFETTGSWQTVRVPFAQMHPEFRGNRLNRPNYPGQNLSMVRFLIGNKKEESFELDIKKIWLE